MLDVRCSTFNLFTVSASLIIKKPCHFGVVSYEVSAQPPASEAGSLIEDKTSLEPKKV
jgi:hypothetical protein